MRVTEGMMSGRLAYTLNSSLSELYKAQSTVSSGLAITKPSDDVTGTARAMRIRSNLNDLDQYCRNSDIVKTQLSLTEVAMNQVVSDMEDVNELAIQAANASLDDDARDAIISQLDSIMESLVSSANTKYNGKYLLSGGNITEEAIVANPDAADPPYVYQGDNAEYNVQIAPTTSITGNVTADSVFNMGSSAVSGSPDIFQTISLLKEEIEAGDTDAISARLTDIQDNLSNVTAIRSQIGSRIARLEDTNDIVLDSQTSMEELLSDTEDADMAKAIIDLAERENVYQAAASSASRILEVSLVDYLS